MRPILFSIGDINFYSYGFFVSMAFLCFYLLTEYLFKKNKISTKYLFEKILLVLFCGFVGARLLYYALYDSLTVRDFFDFAGGGFVSFGGIVFGIATILLLYKKQLSKTIDIFALSFLASAAIWRIGCLLAGDHPGVFSTAWYSINYEIPAILFEIILSILGFVILMALYLRKNISGFYIFLAVIFWYGVERIIVDNFRDDPLMYGLRGGQVAGIIMVFLAIIGLITYKYKNNIKTLWSKLWKNLISTLSIAKKQN